MGCAASKLDNEETVRRSKERHRLMKDAVAARHHLATALSDYVRSLRLTGSALTSFAAGVSLSVSDHTPPVVVFLRPPSRTTPASSCVPPSRTTPIAPHVPPFQSSQLPPRVRTFPCKTDPVPSTTKISAGERRPRTKDPPKLPHILSETSLSSSSPKSEASDFMLPRFGYPSAYLNSNYSASPSQASTAWNWENFYPPSPPDSEFFEQKARERKQQRSHIRSEYDEETERSENEFSPREKRNIFVENDHTAVGGTETQREEVHCSEWGDHDTYSSTSSSEVEENDERGKESGYEAWKRSTVGSPTRTNSSDQQQQQPYPTAHGGAMHGKAVEDLKGGDVSKMKMVVSHKDLKEIVEAVKEYFDKAASAGDQASAKLEIGKAQMDQSFRQLKSKLPSFSFSFSLPLNRNY